MGVPGAWPGTVPGQALKRSKGTTSSALTVGRACGEGLGCMPGLMTADRVARRLLAAASDLDRSYPWVDEFALSLWTRAALIKPFASAAGKNFLRQIA
jgi:hypothetical protein